jgi:antitoxin (DNA-binding transcriptional repressor) of toxin-antitoxin stability system
MNYISTTELRKKSSTLRESLKRGENTYILHRSKVIGLVEPYEETHKTFSLKQLDKLRKTVVASKVQYTYREREKLYAKHLEDKYGKSIS